MLRGLITTVLLITNTLLLFIPLLGFAIIKILTPIASIQKYCSRILVLIAESWAELDKVIFSAMTKTQWEIKGVESLDRAASYMIISNHQSWVDIPALIQTFNRKIPYFKFFLKKELIWVPLLGFVWWVLDYPFMQRYSKAFIERHPECKGKDLELTKSACEKFKAIPVTIVNYLEGTRFSPSKHAAQQSPYQQLLKPRAGGLAFALAAIGEQLNTILDVTVVYPNMNVTPSFWDLMSGKVDRVVVDVRSLPIEPWMYEGDYENDPHFRASFQHWVSTIWHEKDRTIARYQVATENVGNFDQVQV